MNHSTNNPIRFGHNSSDFVRLDENLMKRGNYRGIELVSSAWMVENSFMLLCAYMFLYLIGR